MVKCMMRQMSSLPDRSNEKTMQVALLYQIPKIASDASSVTSNVVDEIYVERRGRNLMDREIYYRPII